MRFYDLLRGSRLHTPTALSKSVKLRWLDMKVFISWSGERARAVAESLRDWLPDVIQSVEPWVSSEDIGAGERWNTQIAKELSETRFGIICVTPENQQAPWLLFETGALAKTIEDTNVCPYLIGLGKSDLKPGPLTQFQAMDANEKETWKLIRTMNNSSGGEQLEEMRLQRIFERSWSILEESLSSLPEIKQNVEPRRDNEAMTEEILELVREIARKQRGVSTESGFATGIHNPWFQVQRRASAQLKAFLMPAKSEIDRENRTVILWYADSFKFHFSQIKSRKNELFQLVSRVLGEDVIIRVTGPGDELIMDTSFPDEFF